MSSVNIPIQHLRSSTAGAVPTSAQLMQGQLAINLADKKFFTLNASGVVTTVGVAPGDLSVVATTGSYNDLLNKPDIQSQYVLPAASATVLGGVKVASTSGLAVDTNGNLTNAGVTSVNTRTGAVTLTATDVGLPTDLLSGPSSTLASKYLPSSITGGLAYQGVWNANTNSPTLASGGIGPGGSQLPNGDYYVVNTAGSTTLDGISTWTVGDLALVSNGVWTRIANSGSTVTSVANKTGAVTLVPGDITGLAAVASSGSYTDLTNKPTAYSLPIATTTTLGGVILSTTAGQAGNASTGTLATVAVSGSYNDLLNLPANPSVARLPVNLQGNPNVLDEVFYMFTDQCQFPTNFTGSVVFADLQSGTTATVAIYHYTSATDPGTQIGQININTAGSNTFTSSVTTPTFQIGDRLSYRFVTTNITLITITIRGTWQ